jgi:hypothetical protein
MYTSHIHTSYIDPCINMQTIRTNICTAREYAFNLTVISFKKGGKIIYQDLSHHFINVDILQYRCCETFSWDKLLLFTKLGSGFRRHSTSAVKMEARHSSGNQYITTTRHQNPKRNTRKTVYRLTWKSIMLHVNNMLHPGGEILKINGTFGISFISCLLQQWCTKIEDLLCNGDLMRLQPLCSFNPLRNISYQIQRR